MLALNVNVDLLEDLPAVDEVQSNLVLGENEIDIGSLLVGRKSISFGLQDGLTMFGYSKVKGGKPQYMLTLTFNIKNTLARGAQKKMYITVPAAGVGQSLLAVKGDL